jgi:hypothetical protein
MDPFAREIELVNELLRDTDGYEYDQIAWRLNDGLLEQGIDPVPVYLELMRRGRTEFLMTLRLLGADAVVQALPDLLDEQTRIPLFELREVVDGLVPEAVPTLAAGLADRTDPSVRGLIVNALGEMGPWAAAAVPNLLAIVRDRKVDVCELELVAGALAKIGVATPEVLAALDEALTRQEPIPGCTSLADARRALGEAARRGDG